MRYVLQDLPRLYELIKASPTIPKLVIRRSVSGGPDATLSSALAKPRDCRIYLDVLDRKLCMASTLQDLVLSSVESVSSICLSVEYLGAKRAQPWGSVINEPSSQAKSYVEN